MRSIWEIRADVRKVNDLEVQIEKRVAAKSASVQSLADPTTGESVEITADYIKVVIRSLAKQFIADMKGQRVLLLGLMDGVGFFAEEFLRAIEAENQENTSEDAFIVEYATLVTASYHGTESGKLTIGSLKAAVGERVVLVLDDVLDTGKTLNGVIEMLISKGATKVCSMVLFDKVIMDRAMQADYIGVRVPSDLFYVGAGMDYLTPRFRRLPTLKAVDRSTLATADEQQILSKKDALNHELETVIAAKKNFNTTVSDKHATSYQMGVEDGDYVASSVDINVRLGTYAN